MNTSVAKSIDSNYKIFLKLLTLFFVSSVLFYFLPRGIVAIYFFLLLFVCLFSREDAFWFVFFFLIIHPPGGLFLDGNALPTIGVGNKEIWYKELVLIVFYMKALMRAKPRRLFFAIPLFVLLSYLSIIYIKSFDYGISTVRLFRSFRFLLSWSLLFSLPRLFRDEEDYAMVFSLLFPLSVFLLFETIFEYGTGIKMAFLFGAKSVYTGFGGEIEGQFVTDSFRIFNSPLIIFITFIGALYFNQRKKFFTSKKTLLAIVVCYLLAFLSATRGWIIAFSMIFLMSALIFKGELFKKLSYIVLLIFIATVSASFVPKLAQKIDYTLERVSTIGKILDGDLTAGGTLKRLTVRNDKVMEQVKKDWLTGYGFSEQYWTYFDQHVGNQSMILQGGVIGYLLWLFFWSWYNFKLLALARKTHYRPLLIFILAFGGLFLIHSSSVQIYQYAMQIQAAFLVFFMYSFANSVYYQVLD